MRHSLLTVLLLGAATILHADNLPKEVQIPFAGEQFKYVTFYAPPAERGQVQVRKEDGTLHLEWKTRTKISKACFNAKLFEGILADLQGKKIQPVEFVVGIRYEGTDLPKIETYLYSSKFKRNKPFYFRLKQGYSEYSIKYDDLPNLDQYQIRGPVSGSKSFIVEKLAFRMKTAESNGK